MRFIHKKNINQKHFCIFDELYSGTNPYEAVSNGTAYLKYINSKKNIKFLITTHYSKICNLFRSDSNIDNIFMKTYFRNGHMKYTYKIEKGISKIKGGVCVLRQLKYPKKIIKDSQKIIRGL